jgi:glycosyltransferase involved in cell wall biosynthesis
MISVVIATLNDERTLGETMGALIAAAVDGLVREVIVVDAGSSDHTLEIADDAGARILKASGPTAVAQGCAMARSDWLLILDARAAPPTGWEKAAADHIREHGDQAGWWTAKPGLWLFGGRPQAVLAPKRLAGAGFSGALGRLGRRIRIAR